jgi:hypothetical protein
MSSVRFRSQSPLREMHCAGSQVIRMPAVHREQERGVIIAGTSLEYARRFNNERSRMNIPDLMRKSQDGKRQSPTEFMQQLSQPPDSSELKSEPTPETRKRKPKKAGAKQWRVGDHGDVPRHPAWRVRRGGASGDLRDQGEQHVHGLRRVRGDLFKEPGRIAAGHCPGRSSLGGGSGLPPCCTASDMAARSFLPEAWPGTTPWCNCSGRSLK